MLEVEVYLYNEHESVNLELCENKGNFRQCKEHISTVYSGQWNQPSFTENSMKTNMSTNILVNSPNWLGQSHASLGLQSK